MRRIPITMATQHPDNASAPFWNTSSAFVGAYQEMQEAVECYQQLNVDEYMWDWEGKHADAAVIDRLYSERFDYFEQTQLGRDKFLTFRLPNIWEEKGYNLLQAMTVMLSSEDFARDLKFDGRPLFEFILPMTETAEQLIHMQKLFQKVADFKSKEFTSDDEVNNDYLEVIPLVESVESQISVANLLRKYIKLHQQHFDFKPKYMRVFLACSDSALSSGFLSGIIGNKIALSELQVFQKESGIRIFPILGSGGLLFRGGLSPSSIDRFLLEFKGVKTVSVQSSFRYDHPISVVKQAIKKLETSLENPAKKIIKESSKKHLLEIIKISTQFYVNSLAGIVNDLDKVFAAVPKRRDRRQHIGLLSYARSSGEHVLPRAITFTAGMYSIGLPPEFIGLGRSLSALNQAQLATLMDEYPSIKQDLIEAGNYINKSNIKKMSIKNPYWDEILEDIYLTEQTLSIKLGPLTPEAQAHHELSSALLQTRDSDHITGLINEMAVLRKSLG